ncbi:MAG: glycosyltransferase family 4 protein [Candidatus Bathyarchaeota archaeon]|nr:glycosyltransferase family 4 protein [Candidatus Bathyarchaeota archaeon]
MPNLPINVLMLGENLPPIEGGIENHIHNLVKALGLYCNITLLVSNRPPNTPFYEKMGNVKIYRLSPNKISYSAHILAALKLAEQNNIQLIHVHTLGRISIVGTVLSIILRKPLIITVHESNFIIDLTSKRHRLRTFLTYYLLLKFSKLVITPSYELKYYVKQVSDGKKEVREISNGVDESLFKPMSGLQFLTKYGIAGNRVIICPRRITPKNGIIYLIEAIPKIIESVGENVKFVFAGPVRTESYFRSIQRKVCELKINPYVIFTGGIPFAEMPVVYAAADIVVIPSLIEAISLAALEAMACEKPIVATAVGGLTEIINNDYNGLLVKPANAEGLAEAIIKLLKDSELASKYSQNGAKTVKAYYWSSIANDTLNAYHTVTRESKPIVES